MALDPSIYQQVGAGVKSVADYDAIANQAQANKLALIMQQHQVANLPLQDQLLQYQIASAGIGNQKANALLDLSKQILGGSAPQSDSQPNTLQSAGSTAQSYPVSSPGQATQAQPGVAVAPTGLGGLTFPRMVALKTLGGPDLSADYKMAVEGVSHAPGSEVTNVVDGTRRTVPVLDKGQTLGPDGVISNIPGFVNSSADTAAAVAEATEAAKAKQTPLPLTYQTTVTDPATGLTKIVPVGGTQYAYMHPNSPTGPVSPAPAVGAPAAAGAGAPGLSAPISSVPAGPYIATRDGDGTPVKPTQGITQAQIVADAIAHGQDPTTIKINGAPAFSTDMQTQLDAAKAGGQAGIAAFAAKVIPLLGGDPQKMAAFAYDLHTPPGTPGHALFGAGGPQTSVSPPTAAPTGPVQLAGPTDAELASAGVKLRTQPAIDAATTTAGGAAKSGQVYQDKLNQDVQEALSQRRLNNEVLAQINDYQTGIGSADVRTKVASNLKNMFPNDPRVQDLASDINGGSVVSAQTLHNLVVGAAMRNAIATLQGQGRISQGEVKAFTAAAENPSTDPGAFQRIIAIQNKAGDQTVAEQQALSAAIRAGTYDPRTWQADWHARQYQGLSDPTHADPLFAPATNTATPTGFKYIGKVK